LSNFQGKWLSTSEGGWDRPPSSDELETLRLNLGDFPKGFAFQGTEINICHKWDADLAELKCVEGDAARTSPMSYAPGALGVSAFSVFSSPSEMAAGSWRVDKRKRKVFVKPYEGEDLRGSVVEAPGSASILSFGSDVSGLEMSGLAFTLSGASLFVEGFGAGNAPGAIDGIKRLKG
jgi:hypothetical protein